MQGMIKSWNKWAPSKNWTECCLNRLTLINEAPLLQISLKNYDRNHPSKTLEPWQKYHSKVFISFSYLNLISLKIKSRSFWRNCNTGWFSNKLSFLTFPPSLLLLQLLNLIFRLQNFCWRIKFLRSILIHRQNRSKDYFSLVLEQAMYSYSKLAN